MFNFDVRIELIRMAITVFNFYFNLFNGLSDHPIVNLVEDPLVDFSEFDVEWDLDLLMLAQFFMIVVSNHSRKIVVTRYFAHCLLFKLL